MSQQRIKGKTDFVHGFAMGPNYYVLETSAGYGALMVSRQSDQDSYTCVGLADSVDEARQCGKHNGWHETHTPRSGRRVRAAVGYTYAPREAANKIT